MDVISNNKIGGDILLQKFQLEYYIIKPEVKISKRMVYKDDKVIAFVLNIASSESLPRHTHFQSTVLIKVIQGEGQLLVNSEKVPIQSNELIQLDGPESMSIDNTGDDHLVLYVTISPAPPEEKFAVDVDL